MNKFTKLVAGLTIAGQIAGCNTQGNINQGESIEGNNKEIETSIAQNSMKNTEEALYDSLESKNNFIKYQIKQGATIYKDSKGQEKFFNSPKGVVIYNNAIDEELSNEQYLCLKYGGKKVYINRNNLIENNDKSIYELDKPTTEKVIIVNKAERKMVIYDQYGSHKVNEFKIAISSFDDGDKKIQGDGNTPEGKYYICYKNPASSFGRNPKTGGRIGSLQVSYPNSQDAFEGLISGDITKLQFNSINTSVSGKKVPSQRTNLGNYIMIHGGGSDRDRTLGCMALDDEDMLWLYDYIDSGVDIYIE